MRVLMLGSKEYPFGSSAGSDPISSGGIEACVQNLSECLASQGTRVTIITRRFPGQKKREKHGNLEIARVGWLGGFHLRNPSFNFCAFAAALGGGYDAVHAHGPIASLFGWLAARLKGKKIIATPHGIAWAQPQYGFLVSRLLRAAEKFAYSRADAVVFLSEAERREFKNKMGFLPRNSFVIPSGIPLEKYGDGTGRARTRAKLGLGKDFTFVYVGRLAKVKGVDYLLEACRGLGAQVLIAGDGPEMQALKKSAPKNVEFLGNRRGIPGILSAADAFILPSLSEGLPVALLEALATGLPCIVTDIGLPVEDGKNALVVPPKNAGALRRAMLKIAASAELRKKLSTGALKLSKNYSAEKCAERHARVYAGLAPQAK
ncbi:hypothetical protein COX86_04145 [Candidatus Micrarchaeota archaeon CG_4_10_14_0_2_um_filter_60_11]|nr:MAG: hypothetical protein AUJ16_00750 [Candidatus Micrarchaeota archaeon CG1_02_60_51]PIN96213.1 MAG: hypothetical protein COU39_02270 [Candidatus Micrarchaeota archaeon CG10_big_fil_rev_8_21_14_0_10_60_32]PIY91112.1 MAG: hypothetical protein COY71_04930 [Candidatus Micrarchaeota archaeon CG_4_10_14_0_8_um_filter_60_7]PIZ90605.1 MAG: hypothetical protein COX86_04145 [Candidatus Micrarchaeota archaeon CG_4_10_14_0_2_um_filter_60_11]